MSLVDVAKVTKYRPLPLILLTVSIGLALAIGIWLIRRGDSSSVDHVYFAETDHAVEGEFYTFFRDHGGLEVFGFPITEQFSQDGRTIQYFQRARMELHPENAADNRIQLADIASEMGFDDARTPESQNPPDSLTRVYFPETGHSLELPFLRFFNEHGGVDIFGMPITEVIESGDRATQYFQRARMDYYPARPLGQQVQLADLGNSHFVFAGIDPVHLRGVGAAEIASDPEGAPKYLKIDAQVADPNAAAPAFQLLFVYVTDENDKPIADAVVKYELDYPDGPQSGEMPRTNADGYTSVRFQLEPVPPGQKLPIHVTASKDSLTASTVFSSLPRQ